jgi:hypothetical protein
MYIIFFNFFWGGGQDTVIESDLFDLIDTTVIYSSIESDFALRPAELECPSDNVITTTYRCQVGHS